MDQRINDLLREARAADRIDRERIELFEAMVRTPAWLEYVAILESKLQTLADEILAPAKSIDAMVGLEYVKGAMSGLIMARDIPSVTIAAKPELNQPVEDDDDDEPAG